MKIKDKIKLYYPDFLYQTVVFYIALISPIGVLPYYLMGADADSMLWRELFYLNKYFSMSHLFETIFDFLVWGPLKAMVLSAPLSFANIYILRINSYKHTDFGYLTIKITFMMIAWVFIFPYILIVSGGNYHAVIYSSLPALLTFIVYFYYVRYKEQKNSRKEAS